MDVCHLHVSLAPGLPRPASHPILAPGVDFSSHQCECGQSVPTCLYLTASIQFGERRKCRHASSQAFTCLEAGNACLPQIFRGKELHSVQVLLFLAAIWQFSPVVVTATTAIWRLISKALKLRSEPAESQVRSTLPCIPIMMCTCATPAQHAAGVTLGCYRCTFLNAWELKGNSSRH